jgi:O-antigen/teichoic acid export membrane protein
VLDVFGPGFRDGATALTILCGSMLLAMATGNSQTVLLMSGRSLWQMGNKAVILAVNLALNFALIPRWGMNGAALAWSGTIVLDSVTVVLAVRYLVGVRLAGAGLLRATTLSLLSFGVIGVVLRVFTDLGPLVAIAGVLASSALHVLFVYRERHHFDLDVLKAAARRRRPAPQPVTEEPS